MNIGEMIVSGGVNPLLLFAVALILGALHGLEPGHSKTMIAAYIIAVRGSVKQAILLGASAALSHSIIVWVLAFLALYYGNALIGEELEPWFMMASGALVLGIAGWMLWRGTSLSGSGQTTSQGHHHHHHDHDHDLTAAHQDAHARAHAADIKTRVASGRLGTWQTVMFGLTGGLIPCPAAITVFLLCLQLGQITLGITLVGAFSIGLALTLVGIGIVTSLGLRAFSSRSSRFDTIMTAAPWISAALIAAIGCVIIWSGYSHLHGLHHSH
ncbi:MAG: nickel/cobalt efflux transporter [Pseudomonadota bacterium]